MQEELAFSHWKARARKVLAPAQIAEVEAVMLPWLEKRHEFDYVWCLRAKNRADKVNQEHAELVARVETCEKERRAEVEKLHEEAKTKLCEIHERYAERSRADREAIAKIRKKALKKYSADAKAAYDEFKRQNPVPELPCVCGNETCKKRKSDDADNADNADNALRCRQKIKFI